MKPLHYITDQCLEKEDTSMISLNVLEPSGWFSGIYNLFNNDYLLLLFKVKICNNIIFNVIKITIILI